MAASYAQGMSDSDSGKYWFCVKHHRVESGEDICPPIDRLGPYPTAQDAERALSKAAERNEEWDNDPRWNDPK